MNAFVAQTKCPDDYAERLVGAAVTGEAGFFKFHGLRLFGRTSQGTTSRNCADNLPSLEAQANINSKSICLPFDLTAVMENLRLERYVGAVNSEISYIADNKSLARRVYYALRPLLPVAFRRILQRAALQDWAKISFPNWPVDTTVEDLVNRLWALLLTETSEAEIPFIWYWPKGFNGCAIMTHDVETAGGQDFCPRILELERDYGIRSSFELVPEVRYEISDKVVEAIRRAGSEVCIHGLNHDGRLFSSEAEFRRRAKLINQYAQRYGAKGFRSPVMYRNPDWYDEFGFAYDMSFPNVAHLDPQRGGCCTVLPFFIGNVLELPLTTTQDYPLYHILRVDPLEMWTRQMDVILAKNGLVSFIIHPDYTFQREKQALYVKLLGLLRKYEREQRMWLALPGEVDTWWRERNKMTLTRENGKWTICGEGASRASVACARLVNHQVRLATEWQGEVGR